MTTDDTSPRHPGVEALSAHLDGEAPEMASHVAECTECRTTLRWLRMASTLVATPVPPVAASARDQAVAQALEAFESGPDVAQGRETVSAMVRPQPESGPAFRPAPRPARPVEPVTPIESGRRRSRGGSGMWVGVGSAAAVLLAVVVGLGVLGGGGGGGDGDGTVAAGPPAAESKTTERATERAGAGVASDAATEPGVSIMGATGGRGSFASTPAGGVDGGDLGDIPDAPALAARAGPGLPPAPVPTGSPAPAVPEAGDLQSATPGTRPCEMEARSARPGLGTVVYYAVGRVDGVPVVILGFDPSPVTLLALVQQEGCRIALEAAGP